MIITIDGPSGTGKSTLAKLLAKKLNFCFFDTGAMYRAVTFGVLEKNIDPSDERAIANFLKDFAFEEKEFSKGEKKYFIGDRDITRKIRLQEVTKWVSVVSAHPCVRKKLVALQRVLAKGTHAVFEGRDMGSYVFPKAQLKFFLTAKASVRAQRRWNEHPDKASISLEEIEKDLFRRDSFDSSRKISPLICPKDAIRIDTSDLSLEEVLEKLIQEGKRKIQKILSRKIPDKKMKFFYKMILSLTRGGFKIFYHHRVFGLEHFCPGGAILASNHLSFLDPPTVAISSPEEIHFLARKTLFDVPLIGRLITRLNTHPISRQMSDVSTFRVIGRLLNEGKKVLLFPEGTRSRTGKVGKMLPGISFLSYSQNVPIIPVYVHGTYDIWRATKKFPKFSGNVTCVFGSPIDPKEFSHLEKKDAMNQMTLRMEESLNKLQKWVEEGCLGLSP